MLKMESQLTTADVYQTASLIGKDMEQIIETFGHSAVMDLMPKVIQVLEQLEIAVGEKEKSLLELEEMRLQNERLLTEVKKEAGQRRRLDEELYQHKQQSTREISELNNILEKLRDENQTLQAEEKAHKMEKEEVQRLSSADLAVLENMKSTIDNQRDAIRSKNSEIQSVKSDLEAMEEQVERLANINETIRRNLTLQKSRNSTLAQEKADLEGEVKALNQQLSKSGNGLAKRLNNELDNKTEKSAENKLEDKENMPSPSKDPNRPRFTLKELQRVLAERNELKERVLSLEEDLASYTEKLSKDGVDSASLELNTSPVKTKEKEKHVHKSGISKLFKFLSKEEHKSEKTSVKTNDYIVIDSPKT